MSWAKNIEDALTYLKGLYDKQPALEGTDKAKVSLYVKKSANGDTVLALGKAADADSIPVALSTEALAALETISIGGPFGDQLKAASLSVTPATDIADGRYIGDIKFGEELPAGTQFVGRTGVKAFKFSQSFTRLATAVAYSAGDAVNNSDSAPAILSQDLTSFGAALSQFLVITNVQVVLSIANTTANIDCWVFNQTFAATNDNAALAIDDTTMTSGGWCIGLPNNKSTTLNTKLQSDPSQYLMQLAGSGTPSLFVTLQTPAGYTPSASAVYTVIINGYLL